MTEEEENQLRQENAALKEAVAQKDRRIEELEGLLMSALLRIEELERRLASDARGTRVKRVENRQGDRLVTKVTP